MDSGKRFEGKFHDSLRLLDGASMRIEDGGRGAKNPQLGDFLLWCGVDETFLFECKATGDGRLEFRRLCKKGKDGKSQMDRLLGFSDLRDCHHSLIAINFYGKDVARENRCVLVEAHVMEAYINETGRASIPLADALQIGHECPVIKGNIWEVDPWAALPERGSAC